MQLKKKQLTISNETLVSSLQFVSCAGNAGWSKFSSLFFLDHGITPSQLAVITSIQSITKLLGYPTFGMLADFFGNSKSLLLFSLLMSNIILLSFYFDSTKTLIFGNFYLLLFIRGLRSYTNSIWTLIDAVTMKLIQDKKSYGKHRLYASIAWGLSSSIAGKLIDLKGMNAIFVYGLFWSILSFGLIYFGLPTNAPNYEQHKYESLSTIDLNTTENDSNNNKKQQVNNSNNKFEFCQIFKLLISLRHDYQFIFCIILMVIYWNVMFIIERIIFIQMDQEFGASKFQNGIATLCSTIAEIPFFYYSASLLKRFSLNTIYCFCHIVLIIRLFAYTLCKDINMVWIIYVIQTLHGINFGLGFSVCRIYLYQIGEHYSTSNESGINVRATIQSLKGTISLIAMFTGGLIWLPLYDYYTARTVYFYGSVALIPSILILWTQCSSNNKLLNVFQS